MCLYSGRAGPARIPRAPGRGGHAPRMVEDGVVAAPAPRPLHRAHLLQPPRLEAHGTWPGTSPRGSPRGDGGCAWSPPGTTRRYRPTRSSTVSRSCVRRCWRRSARARSASTSPAWRCGRWAAPRWSTCTSRWSRPGCSARLSPVPVVSTYHCDVSLPTGDGPVLRRVVNHVQHRAIDLSSGVDLHRSAAAVVSSEDYARHSRLARHRRPPRGRAPAVPAARGRASDVPAGRRIPRRLSRADRRGEGRGAPRRRLPRPRRPRRPAAHRRRLRGRGRRQRRGHRAPSHPRRPAHHDARIHSGGRPRRLLRLARRVRADVGQRLRGVRHRAGRRDDGRRARAGQRPARRAHRGGGDRVRRRRRAPRRRRPDHRAGPPAGRPPDTAAGRTAAARRYSVDAVLDAYEAVFTKAAGR